MASAHIERLEAIASLPALVRPGDVVLMDIDDTLVRPEPDATEAWFVKFCSAIKAGSDDATVKSNVFMAGVELWCALQDVCDVSTPEQQATSAALHAVAAMPGVTIVGLTARGPEIADETVRQLRRCGVYDGVFEQHSLGELKPAARGDGVAALTHAAGVVYCSGSRKPEGLFAFEEAAAVSRSTTFNTRRVVLVDDREAHVSALCEAMRVRARPFLGLHYVGAPVSSEALPRGWQLLAAVMGKAHGRQKLRRMLGLLGSEKPQQHPTSGTLVVTFVAGAVTGAAAAALVLLRRRL